MLIDFRSRNAHSGRKEAAQYFHPMLTFILDEEKSTADLFHKNLISRLQDGVNVDPNQEDEFGRSALCWAAGNNFVDVVQDLLAQDDVNVAFMDQNGETLLYIAADVGHKSIVQLLLSDGRIGVNTRTHILGYTALSIAAKNGHNAVVKLLLEWKEIAADVKSNHRMTPL